MIDLSLFLAKYLITLLNSLLKKSHLQASILKLKNFLNKIDCLRKEILLVIHGRYVMGGPFLLKLVEKLFHKCFLTKVGTNLSCFCT